MPPFLYSHPPVELAVISSCPAVELPLFQHLFTSRETIVCNCSIFFLINLLDQEQQSVI